MAFLELLSRCDALLAAEREEQQTHGLQEQPKGIARASLYPYQLEGLNWLISLYKSGVSGILGDDMGLGKTLQSLSMLQYLYEKERCKGPFIVIAPLSTAVNWSEEAAKFTPGLKTVLYIGDMQQREKERTKIIQYILDEKNNTKFERKHCPNLPFQILITTYEIAMRDAAFLAKFRWEYMVIDEAQRLKNPASSLVATLKQFHVRSKLLLTGTPLQNNIRELWSLLNFIMPDVFPSDQHFCAWFSRIDWKEHSKKTGGGSLPPAAGAKSPAGSDAALLEQLHDVIRPFLLRRLKKDANLELPTKREVVLYTGLSAMQKKYYKWILTKNVKAIAQQQAVDGQTPSAGRMPSFANAVMHLRKCCNHPYLFDGAEPMINGEYTLGDHLVENSSKLAVLDLLLQQLRQEGLKVLIFSQMTRMLDILQDYMHLRGYGYQRLDGSLRSEERNVAIKSFQEKDGEDFVFLLSTRAGGVGLNLVAASVVVFYDSDWNPQMDKQAEARVHRIGQKRDVLVIRLVCRSTIEDVIQRRTKKKLLITQAVIEEGQFSSLSQDTDAMDEEDEEDDSTTAAQMMKSVIKYGVRDICSDKPDDPPVTAADIRRILHPEEGPTEQPQLRRSAMQRAETLVALPSDSDGEAEVLDSMDIDSDSEVAYDDFLNSRSGDEEGEGVDSVMAQLAAEHSTQLSPTAVGGKRPRHRPSEIMSEEEADALATKRAKTAAAQRRQREERAAKKLEQDRADREALWVANNYKSLSLEQPQSPRFAPRASGKLTFASGNVFAPQTPGNRIIVMCVDDSGRWAKGGLFAAADALSSAVRKAYVTAHTNRDLVLGSCHLLQVYEPDANCTTYVALAVVQKFNKRAKAYIPSPVKLPLVEEALGALAAAAATLQASVHLPRIGAKTAGFNWYATERIIRKQLCSAGVDAVVYYYARSKRQQQGGRRQQQWSGRRSGHSTQAAPAPRAGPSHPPAASDIMSDSDDDTEEIDDLQAALSRGSISSLPTRGSSQAGQQQRAATSDFSPKPPAGGGLQRATTVQPSLAAAGSLFAGLTTPLPCQLRGMSVAIIGVQPALAQALCRFVVACGGEATPQLTPDTRVLVVPTGTKEAAVHAKLPAARGKRICFPEDVFSLR